MRKIILSAIVILLISATPYRHPNGLTLLKLEVIKDVLATTIDESELTTLLAKMNPDGSWPDIDYTDKTRGGWPVNGHLVRLNELAVMYTRNKGDEAVKNKILSGLDYWFKNDFICPNWWYPQIGVPKVLGPTMILMEKDLSAEQKAAGIKILDRAKIGMTGQNKVWLSGNVIYKGILIDSFDLVSRRGRHPERNRGIPGGRHPARLFLSSAWTSAAVWKLRSLLCRRHAEMGRYLSTDRVSFSRSADTDSKGLPGKWYEMDCLE